MESNPGQDLRHSIRGLWGVGIVTILLSFGAFGSWAVLAPLSSAAIATGQISPDGSQRVVQHLEGGIVRNLYVKEGDLVKKGQLLLVLDKAQAYANFQSKHRKINRLRVLRDRLQAQGRGAKSFVVEIKDLRSFDKNYEQFVKNEINTFKLKQKLIKEQFDIYGRQIHQVKNEIESLQAQVDGANNQLKFLMREVKAKRSLLRKGLLRAPELLVLERKRVELIAEKNAIRSTMSRAGQKIEEIKLAKLTLKTEALGKVADELAKVNADIVQAEEALHATDDVLRRTDILSPIEGRIIKLNSKTIGGVVRTGEPILSIVPVNEELIVDARLSPTDIDNVKIGMKAKVQLSSFMARHLLPLEGSVLQIGADVVTDPDTREKYYTLRVRVKESDIKRVTGGVDLQPGMPAEVFVQTGIHTPFRYLADPLIKSFNRAFREESM